MAVISCRMHLECPTDLLGLHETSSCVVSDKSTISYSETFSRVLVIPSHENHLLSSLGDWNWAQCLDDKARSFYPCIIFPKREANLYNVLMSWGNILQEKWAAATCYLAQGHLWQRREQNVALLIPTLVPWIPGHSAAAATCGDGLSAFKAVKTQQLL